MPSPVKAIMPPSCSGAVDPDQPIFGIHAEGEIGDLVFAFAEFARDQPDRLNGVDLDTSKNGLFRHDAAYKSEQAAPIVIG
jgi:hypothetical protein